MTIAIYARSTKDNHAGYIEQIYRYLKNENVEVIIHEPYYRFLKASTDFKLVGQTIIKNRVDTLLGMPSYLIQLFRENHETFKIYRGIKKIFFGGSEADQLKLFIMKSGLLVGGRFFLLMASAS